MKRLHLSERRLLLLLGDIAGGVGALLAVTWFLGIGARPENLPVAVWCLTLAVIDGTIGQATAALDLRRAASPFGSAYHGGRAWLVAALTYLAVPYLSAPLLSSRYVVLQFVVAGLVVRIAWRLAYAAVARQPRLVTRYVIAGCGPGAVAIASAIATTLGDGHHVTGCVGEPGGEAGSNGAPNGGLAYLGGVDVLADLIADGQVETLVLADGGALSPALQRQVIAAYERGVRVVAMPTLYEDVTGRVLIDHAREFWTATLPELDQNWWYRLVSRTADLIAGIAGMVAAAVLAPVVYAAMRTSGPGPLLYRQVRLGQHGVPFALWKFRTMVPNAEADGGAQWARPGDARVTRAGRWLRRTRLDEFPQFWNILRGEMSLIGPRPERPELVARLEAAVPFYRVRLAVRPGLTGWAQVNAGYASSEADTLVKVQYDLFYLRHRSLYLDLMIALKTVGVVLRFRGQ